MEYSLDDAGALLSHTPAALRALLSGLPDGWTGGDEGPGTWSPYQVLGHLTHIEESDWIDRTRVILEHGVSRPFDPVDREAGFSRFAGFTVDELLDRFAEVRAANLVALRSLVDGGALARRGMHPVFGEVTLAQLLATWVVHDLNHLGQIVKAMAKQYREAIGPWRDLLPILDAP
jgi:uncharacterized damage-inducible protein DinB